MAKLPRILLKVFGLTGSSSYFGKFGSRAAGSPVYTKDVSLIQSLGAWSTGFQDAINANNKAMFLEDINAVLHTLSYMQGYQYQEGIAEYDTSTTYHTNSIVKKSGTVELYSSLTNDNVGNALGTQASTAYWKYLGNLASPSISGGFKIGYFERLFSAGTGNQSITSVGFKPSLIIFIGSNSYSYAATYGIDDGTNMFNLATGGSVGSGSIVTTSSIVKYGTSEGSYSGKVYSLDADGFTIVWSGSATHAGSMKIGYLAFR